MWEVEKSLDCLRVFEASDCSTHFLFVHNVLRWIMGSCFSHNLLDFLLDIPLVNKLPLKCEIILSHIFGLIRIGKID